MTGHDTSVHIARTSERELTITRIVAGPRVLVFRAWSEADLFRRWWLPDAFGMTIVDCVKDVRTGGSYRLEIGHAGSDQTMVFHGRYIEVVPPESIQWTNEESDDGQVTTVQLEDLGDATRVTVRETFPTAAALDAAIASGATSGWEPQLAQLEALLADPALI